MLGSRAWQVSGTWRGPQAAPQVPTLTRRAALQQTLPHPAALNTGGEGLLPSHHTDEEAEALSGPQGSA